MALSEVEINTLALTTFLGDVECGQLAKVDVDGVSLMNTTSGKEIVLLSDAIPFTLIQKMSTNPLAINRSGEFMVKYSDDDVDITKTLHLLPIFIRGITTAKFTPYNPTQKGTLLCCSNGNSLRPDLKRFTEAPSHICATVERGGECGFYVTPVCDCIKWSENGAKEDKCTLRYEVYFFDLDRKIPLLYIMTGSAITKFRGFLKEIRSKKALNRARGIDTRNCILELSSAMKEGSAIFQPVFKYTEAPEELKGALTEYVEVLRWYKENLPRPEAVTVYNESDDVENPVGMINSAEKVTLAGSEYQSEVPF